jgi:hypothetical protein
VLVLLLLLDLSEHLNDRIGARIRNSPVPAGPVVSGMNCADSVDEKSTDVQTE